MKGFLSSLLQAIKDSTFGTACDHFLFAPNNATTKPPFVRDYLDIKRVMSIVFMALLPVTVMAIWNTGLQSFVYSSQDFYLMQEYLASSSSFKGYFAFGYKYFSPIIKDGLHIFLPFCLLSYAVGGFWEVLFATVRRHQVSEGFLVTGILYALILPPTLPLWMVAVGISVGIVVGKELFGGTGMNIVNPALFSRSIIYFAYPNQMSGNVWVGEKSSLITKSLNIMNKGSDAIDAFSQATCMQYVNLPATIKKLHVDAIASNHATIAFKSDFVLKRFQDYALMHDIKKSFMDLSIAELKVFLTTPLKGGGLGLQSDHFIQAYRFFELKYGLNHFSDTNLFMGNMLGSMGETSKFAILLGAIILVATRVGSFTIMLSFVIGMLATSYLFQFFADPFSVASVTLPLYKHFLIGGATFGLVFMATDPVSAPSNYYAKIVYGLMVGTLVIIIRLMNPAYPEGVMLAILLGNIFAPLMDHYFFKWYRKRKRILR